MRSLNSAPLPGCRSLTVSGSRLVAIALSGWTSLLISGSRPFATDLTTRLNGSLATSPEYQEPAPLVLCSAPTLEPCQPFWPRHCRLHRQKTARMDHCLPTRHSL